MIRGGIIGGLASSRRRSGIADLFFEAAGITDSTQKSAVSTLVVDLASIWNKFAIIYPFVGGNSSAHSYNLVGPSTYQITWGGTLAHNADGITGNGSTGYGNTGYNISLANANSIAFGAYSRTSSVMSQAIMGSSVSAYANIYTRFTDNKSYFRIFEGTGGISGPNSDGSRLFIATRTASNAIAGYRDGSLIASGTGAPGTAGSANLELLRFLGAYSSANLAFAFVSTGLTSSDVAILTAAVNTFQTTLGRNV